MTDIVYLSQLPPVVTVSGPDLIAVTQGSTGAGTGTTRKSTVTQLLDSLTTTVGGSVATAVSAAATASAAATTATTAATSLLSYINIHSSNRAPTAIDDNAHAYATLDTWVAPTGNFVCDRDTAGKAIWEKSVVTKNVLPGDVTLSTGTSPYLLFGLRRMTRAYTANACIDLARITGTVAIQTIGFGPDGMLDVSAAAAFLGGSVGRVAKWYDQSGRGQHAVQGSGLGPVLDLRSSTGTGASLIFDTVMNGTTGGGNHPNYSLPNVSLVIPNGQSLDSQNMTILFLGRARSNIKPCAFFSVNNNSGGSAAELSIATLYPPLTPQQGLVAYYETAAVGAPAYQFVTQTPFVGGISVISGYRVVYVGDRNQISPGAPALTLGGNGMVIGGVGNTEFGYVEMSEIRIDTAGLNTADVRAVSLAMNSGNWLAPQTRDILVYAGDSITEGTASTNARNVSRQIESLLKHPMRIFNQGVAGETLQARVANVGTDAILHQAGVTNNIVLLAEGTNDIGYGYVTTGAALFAYARTYCAAMRSVGFKVVLATLCPAAGRSTLQIQVMNDYNTLVRTQGLTIADAISDRAADPDMGAVGFPSNAALCADGIHPTSLGYSYFAQIDAAAINSILI